MGECEHDFVQGVWSSPKCLHCLMRKEDFDEIVRWQKIVKELEAQSSERNLELYKANRKVEELKALNESFPVCQRHVPDAHAETDCWLCELEVLKDDLEICKKSWLQ
jgi:hypothetical protein